VFSFDQFISDPSFCDKWYAFEVDDSLGLPIIDMDKSNLSFTIEYIGNGLEPLDNNLELEFKDYTVTVVATTGPSQPITKRAPFTLRVKIPCSEFSVIPIAERPLYCPKKPYYDPNMPDWMKNLRDTVIVLGTDTVIELGEPVNRYNQPLNLTLELGSLQDIALYSVQTNTLFVRNLTQ